MSVVNLDDLTAALQHTRVSPSGVSFAGKSLKLNTEDDAKELVEAIQKCPELQYLNLEGNTLGVDASKAIAVALESHPEFKRALWKDLFTGRMKTEIPKALENLGNGLVKSGAQLTELDLSDNAFGPIGVEGLAALLRSPSCYALEELRLNNNGLGITGGKLLAKALTDCYDCSKKAGKTLALKVFIAGRNRLENEGAKALAAVFKIIGTLEEIAMPQNGIYHVGISALSDAFTHNPNLQILNLNDNTMAKKGAEAIAKALPHLQKLKVINFGDCLLRTSGATCLAKALTDSHSNLEELLLESNEIKISAGVALVEAMANKTKLKNLVLDGNQFGEEGRTKLQEKLKTIGKIDTLGSLSADEDEDDDDEEDDNSDLESVSGEENSEAEDDVAEVKTATGGVSVEVEEFLQAPGWENFMNLGNNRMDLLLKKAKPTESIEIDTFLPILMKVAALSNSNKTNVAESAQKCTELLYKELFMWAQNSNSISLVNNALLINLGLIKSEDKKFKPTWNLEGCLHSLKCVVQKNYVPDCTKNTVKVFMQREVSNNGQFLSVVKEILSNLD